MSLAVLQRPACRACHYSVIQSFAAIAGVSLAPASRPRFHAQALPRQERFYTQSRFRAQEQSPSQPRAPEAELQHQGDPEDAETSTPATIPWYLQIDTPEPPAPSHPLAEREMIPDLPSDPPPILSPILQYLSIDSGLDNLSLIDLRHLDPPPALGANLIMLIGTARSVKHLNVSADRFCRWLRSNYKMRPYADGLLGRNELKLKLRRKARRLKLAQSVGNTLEKDKDDGITTGWICVNLGPVDGVVGDVEVEGNEGESVEAETAQQEEDDDGYIGFGSRSAAPRIVVQMFTEEKRDELDLEGLWDVRSARRAKREEKATKAVPSEEEMKSPFYRRKQQLEFEAYDEAARREVYGQF